MSHRNAYDQYERMDHLEISPVTSSGDRIEVALVKVSTKVTHLCYCPSMGKKVTNQDVAVYPEP